MAMANYDELIRSIVGYTYDYECEPEKARSVAILPLLHALGCAMEALDNAEVLRMIGPVVPGTVVPNGFKLPGTLHVLDPVKGAFDLACMIRYLEFSDAFQGKEWGHPSGELSSTLA